MQSNNNFERNPRNNNKPVRIDKKRDRNSSKERIRRERMRKEREREIE